MSACASTSRVASLTCSRGTEAVHRASGEGGASGGSSRNRTRSALADRRVKPAMNRPRGGWCITNAAGERRRRREDSAKKSPHWRHIVINSPDLEVDAHFPGAAERGTRVLPRTEPRQRAPRRELEPSLVSANADGRRLQVHDALDVLLERIFCSALRISVLGRAPAMRTFGTPSSIPGSEHRHGPAFRVDAASRGSSHPTSAADGKEFLAQSTARDRAMTRGVMADIAIDPEERRDVLGAHHCCALVGIPELAQHGTSPPAFHRASAPRRWATARRTSPP